VSTLVSPYGLLPDKNFQPLEQLSVWLLSTGIMVAGVALVEKDEQRILVTREWKLKTLVLAEGNSLNNGIVLSEHTKSLKRCVSWRVNISEIVLISKVCTILKCTEVYSMKKVVKCVVGLLKSFRINLSSRVVNADIVKCVEMSPDF